MPNTEPHPPFFHDTKAATQVGGDLNLQLFLASENATDRETRLLMSVTNGLLLVLADSEQTARMAVVLGDRFAAMRGKSESMTQDLITRFENVLLGSHISAGVNLKALALRVLEFDDAVHDDPTMVDFIPEGD